jgi:translation elongation factor EF-Ts
MKAGRIETYVHSDSITRNKGGAMVKITCDTDFAAKTETFVSFCQHIAKHAYASQCTSWDQIIELFPDDEIERIKLEKELREKIALVEVAILKLDAVGQMTHTETSKIEN